MKSLFDDPEAYIATVAKMLEAEGLSDAADILRVSTVSVSETGFDNWNGGTTTWTLSVAIPSTEYVHLGHRRETIKQEIDTRVQDLVSNYSHDWVQLEIVPLIEGDPEWRSTRAEVSQAVRRNILDGLRIDNISWNGRIEEVEFLERIFDLENIPSNDARFSTVSGDIWQHRVNNPSDWTDDWLFSDPRFNLIGGPTQIFLKFLCETLHPLVRPNRDEVLKLLRNFNEQLKIDGWKLVEEERIAGRPRFVPSRVSNYSDRSVTRAKSVADALNAGWMQKEIERLEKAVDHDPALAIGTAKDLVETCCKSILKKRNVEVSRKADLPELTKKLAEQLQLVPEGISEHSKGAETVRLILRNLSSLTKYLSELRGLYGSGHGKSGEYRGLEPRHARLAVGAAVAFIDFVTETYYRRERDKPKHEIEN